MGERASTKGRETADDLELASASYPHETSTVEAVAWDIQGSKKWCGEHVVTRDPAIRDQWANTPERYGITIVPLYARPAPSGWQDISTAPEDEWLLVATTGGWVGEAMVIDGEWKWATGNVLHSDIVPLKWMPLPEHPASSGPNLADAHKNPLPGEIAP